VQTTLQLKSSKYYPFRQCVFEVLGIQRGMRMRRICHLWPVRLLYFSTLPRKQHFRKKKFTNIKCVFCFSLQLVSETFPILKITNRIGYKKNIGLHAKYPLFWSDFNETSNFLDRLSKNIQVSNSIKICPV